MRYVRRSYIAGTLIVWLAILMGAALALRDTPYVARILLVLTPGIVWFVVVVPWVLLRHRQGGVTRASPAGERVEEE